MDEIAIPLIALTGVAFVLFGRMVSFETMEDADKRRGEEVENCALFGNSFFYVAITIVHCLILAGLLASTELEVEDDNAGLYWTSVIFAIIYLGVYVLQRIVECFDDGLRRPCRK